MSRKQTMILLLLAVLDVVVIGAMGAAMWGQRGAQPMATLMPTLLPTSPAIATWTPTATFAPSPTLPPRLTRTPRPTRTPFPTSTAQPTPTPGPIEISNPDFDFLMPNRISGWQWDAFVNYKPGDDYYPHESYAEPMFMPADDPARQINGSTLKIETLRWLKFRMWVYQSVTVTTGSTVYFQVKANAYSSIDQLIVKAGVHANGGDCEYARWGEKVINQDDGIVTLTSPRVIVGDAGVVTICIYAEPKYPDVNNAAFFDQAKLIVSPPSN